ncbi:hypothetical protein ES705_48189 [subsurface metagenome]
MKIQEILKRPEGKTLEFKRDISSLKPILKTLVAFANTASCWLGSFIADIAAVLYGKILRKRPEEPDWP